MMLVGPMKVRRMRVGWDRPHMQGRGRKRWWSNWTLEIGGCGFSRNTLGEVKAVAAQIRMRARTGRFPLFP